MKQRPILFSGPMVRAILNGSKTQTRRVILPQPEHISWFDHQDGWCARRSADLYEMVTCPYGVPGDRLWVRETFHDTRDLAHLGLPPAIYAADGDDIRDRLTEDSRWKPSIFMPRWASRLTLEVTEVRVERVQEITLGDAIAEGCDSLTNPGSTVSGERDFRALWDSINGPRGFGWDANPWVFVVEFKTVPR